MDQVAFDGQLVGVAGDYGLEVVAGAFTDHFGQEMPAHARIVRAGAAGVPRIWVHNYRALGRNNGYNPFETFVLSGRAEASTEWGIATIDARYVQRPTFSSRDPAVRQTKTSKLRVI
jgi:hypothetical protein